MTPAGTKVERSEVAPPKGFRIARQLAIGRHPILAVFPGLDQLAITARVEPDPEKRAALVARTEIEIVDEDMWMYVAPREVPKSARGRWKPVVSAEKDCIVVGAGHLRESSSLMLFMDICHELRHIVQRQGGADLWPPGVSYVNRWTEVEAYRIVIEEARQLGASDAFLREYLKVEWISDDEHREILAQLGVPAP